MRAVGRSIGLDVHRDFCEVAIAEDGSVRSAGRVETTPEALELFARSLGREDRVVLEVTGGAWEVARILESHVERVIVVSPDDTGIRQARAKTDRLDARTLARGAPVLRTARQLPETDSAALLACANCGSDCGSRMAKARVGGVPLIPRRGAPRNAAPL